MFMILQMLVGEVTPPVTTLDTVALATLASLFWPLAVAALTKRTASDGIRALINFLGSGVLAVIAIWMVPNPSVPVTWQLCLNTFISALVASFVAYKGFWKPTGVTGSITVKTANFGLGSPPTVQTRDKDAEEVAQIDEGNTQPPFKDGEGLFQ